MDSIISLCPVKDFNSFPDSIFHNLMVSSSEPEARYFPSGLNRTEVTSFVWPLNVLMFSPVLASQSLIVSSSDPEAIYFPFGLNLTEVISSLCPFKVLISLPEVISQTLIVLS